MTRCTNPIQGMDLICGDEAPDTLRRYCSEECADREGKAELAALGITQEMLKEAAAGYYECKEMIEKREEERPTSVETPSRSPYSSSQ